MKWIFIFKNYIFTVQFLLNVLPAVWIFLNHYTSPSSSPRRAAAGVEHGGEHQRHLHDAGAAVRGARVRGDRVRHAAGHTLVSGPCNVITVMKLMN